MNAAFRSRRGIEILPVIAAEEKHDLTPLMGAAPSAGEAERLRAVVPEAFAPARLLFSIRQAGLA